MLPFGAWRVLVVKVEVAIGVELYPMVALGRDFCNDYYIEINQAGRNSVLYDMSYKIPYNKISMCMYHTRVYLSIATPGIYTHNV